MYQYFTFGDVNDSNVMSIFIDGTNICNADLSYNVLWASEHTYSKEQKEVCYFFTRRTDHIGIYQGFTVNEDGTISSNTYPDLVLGTDDSQNMVKLVHKSDPNKFVFEDAYDKLDIREIREEMEE